jgi:NCAIR mutase (PurE)-related protein
MNLPKDVQNGVDYHAHSRTAWGEKLPVRKCGRVAVVSAGTSDGAVAWEAGRTLTYLGIDHTMFEDCGVAGLWRLTERISQINEHDAVIVTAGMDAALASVLGGLTPKPVLAVPTSVGYGVGKNGESALRSMLASCAPGISVFNIDNGYGAACAAARIVSALCR